MPSKTSVRDKEDSDGSSLWLRAINRRETWENKVGSTILFNAHLHLYCTVLY